jgi:signal transduction histidine kinase
LVGVIEFFSHQIGPPDEALLTMISTVGKQISQFVTRKRAEGERGQLLERERAARALAEAAERRAAFLARASTALGASLDAAATLQTLAQLAVPTLAEWCTVDVYEQDGTLRRMATAHADPETAATLQGLLERYPPKDPVDHPLYRLLHTGKAELVAEVPPGFLESMAHDRQHLELMRGLGTEAYMLVPIVVRGEPIGAIAFMSRERGRYGLADLELAEDLARRAAMAIDNARLYQEAQDATRRKDEFLAMLGHELRNPLAAIRAAVSVLEHPKTNPDIATRQREIIGRQSMKLGRLVDDLLDVSRVMSGKIVLKRSPIALADAVAACVETFRPAAKSAEQQLVFRALQSVTVDVDPLRLEQIVANLVDNAIKYTPGGGKIEVTVGRDGAEAVIRVRDTGMGIVKYMLPRIFDLFTQSDRALDRAQGGLGLGLTLVRRLVEQHGGRVAAASAGPNKGSEFVIRLPAVVAKPVPRAEPASAAVTTAPSRRVLLIEDNVDGREGAPGADRG